MDNNLVIDIDLFINQLQLEKLQNIDKSKIIQVN